MTRVDFYLLAEANERARQLAACKLAGKAFRLGHRVYLFTASDEQAQALNELLWTFSAGSFIPHGLQSEHMDPVPPVVVGPQPPPPEFADVLISLAPEVPDWFSRFQRVAEIVGGADEDKQRARTRFRFYRDRGYPLATHQLPE
jgi:DNA polymerase-3 subunit chi